MIKKLVKAALARLDRDLVRISDDPVLQSVLRAYKMLNVIDRHGSEYRHALCRLSFESYLSQLIRTHDIDLIIDVGANLGQFALLCRSIGYTGRIVSFEPNEINVERLRAVSLGDPSWSVMSIGLGEREEILSLNVYDDDTFSSVLEVNAVGDRLFGSYVQKRTVMKILIKKLDDVFDQELSTNSSKILLKTDTQGYDLHVLRGAERTLRKVSVLLSELAIQPIYEGASVASEIQEYVTSRGFQVGGIFPVSFASDLSLIEADAFFVRAR